MAACCPCDFGLWVGLSGIGHGQVGSETHHTTSSSHPSLPPKSPPCPVKKCTPISGGGLPKGLIRILGHAPVNGAENDQHHLPAECPGVTWKPEGLHRLRHCDGLWVGLKGIHHRQAGSETCITCFLVRPLPYLTYCNSCINARIKVEKWLK